MFQSPRTTVIPSRVSVAARVVSCPPPSPATVRLLPPARRVVSQQCVLKYLRPCIYQLAIKSSLSTLKVMNIWCVFVELRRLVGNFTLNENYDSDYDVTTSSAYILLRDAVITGVSIAMSKHYSCIY